MSARSPTGSPVRSRDQAAGRRNGHYPPRAQRASSPDAPPTRRVPSVTPASRSAVRSVRGGSGRHLTRLGPTARRLNWQHPHPARRSPHSPAMSTNAVTTMTMRATKRFTDRNRVSVGRAGAAELPLHQRRMTRQSQRLAPIRAPVGSKKWSWSNWTVTVNGSPGPRSG